MISGYNPADTAQGILHKKEKALGTDLYDFHEQLHEILSIAFTEYNLHVLSKEQEKLISKYLEKSEEIDQGICTIEELNQLDQFLGGLTNELYN